MFATGHSLPAVNVFMFSRKFPSGADRVGRELIDFWLRTDRLEG